MTRVEAFEALKEGKRVTHLALKPDDCWFILEDGIITDNFGKEHTYKSLEEWFNKLKFDLGWFEYSLEIRDRKYFQFEKQSEYGY